MGVQVQERYSRDESEIERLDRHWIELLQELRVAQTGVQILFAFLLVIAFTPLLVEAEAFTHAVFATTLVVTAMATGLLIAPVPFHRLVYGRRLRPELVRVAGGMAVGGLLLLVLAVAGGLLLALDVVLPRAVAVGIVAAMAVWFAVFWYVVPVLVRRRSRPHGADGKQAERP